MEEYNSQTKMPVLLLLLLLVVSLLVIGTFFSRLIVRLIHYYLPGITCEAETLVLWSGLLLSALITSLLLIYLVLRY